MSYAQIDNEKNAGISSNKININDYEHAHQKDLMQGFSNSFSADRYGINIYLLCFLPYCYILQYCHIAVIKGFCLMYVCLHVRFCGLFTKFIFLCYNTVFFFVLLFCLLCYECPTACILYLI